MLPCWSVKFHNSLGHSSLGVEDTENAGVKDKFPFIKLYHVCITRTHVVAAGWLINSQYQSRSLLSIKHRIT